MYVVKTKTNIKSLLIGAAGVTQNMQQYSAIVWLLVLQLQ
jgi:hypothetical protein